MSSLVVLGGIAVAVGLAHADSPPRLAWPVGCTLFETCWIVHYVDHDVTEGVRDYACGTATYNAPPGNQHKGTDIAIRDEVAMRAGVEVRAAAPGIIVGVRDGMDDGEVEESDIEAIEGRECGNGVRIDHGGGWATQYCHLRKGSVTVVPKQRVEAGDVLGLIGSSGLSAFPHLHFQVSQGDTIIDPFVGAARTDDACGPGETPLWEPAVFAELSYQPTSVHATGFAGEAPDSKAARQGHYAVAELSRYVPALILWAEAFNVDAGDRLQFRIVGPDGDVVVSRQLAITREHDRWFGSSGRKRPGAAWPPGTYRGEVRLKRAGDPTKSLELIAESQVTLR